MNTILSNYSKVSHFFRQFHVTEDSFEEFFRISIQSLTLKQISEIVTYLNSVFPTANIEKQKKSMRKADYIAYIYQMVSKPLNKDSHSSSSRSKTNISNNSFNSNSLNNLNNRNKTFTITSTPMSNPITISSNTNTNYRRTSEQSLNDNTKIITKSNGLFNSTYNQMNNNTNNYNNNYNNNQINNNNNSTISGVNPYYATNSNRVYTFQDMNRDYPVPPSHQTKVIGLPPIRRIKMTEEEKKKAYDFYENLPEDQKKLYVPPVAFQNSLGIRKDNIDQMNQINTVNLSNCLNEMNNLNNTNQNDQLCQIQTNDKNFVIDKQSLKNSIESFISNNSINFLNQIDQMIQLNQHNQSNQNQMNIDNQQVNNFNNINDSNTFNQFSFFNTNNNNSFHSPSTIVHNPSQITEHSFSQSNTNMTNRSHSSKLSYPKEMKEIKPPRAPPLRETREMKEVKQRKTKQHPFLSSQTNMTNSSQKHKKPVPLEHIFNSYQNHKNQTQVSTNNKTEALLKLLPIEYFETQHPQYLIEEILYCDMFNVYLNQAKFHLTIPQLNENQRIIIRLYDTKKKQTCSDIFIQQLIINSRFVDNLELYCQPLYGQPKTEPAIVRMPVDMTKFVRMGMNSVSMMITTKSEILYSVCLCTYREMPQLIRALYDGTNTNEPKELFERICNKNAPKESNATKEIEVIEIDDSDENDDNNQMNTTSQYSHSNNLSSKNNENKMEEENDEKDEIVLESNIISLRCPLSFIQIELPIKGCLCKHSTVMNAQGLLEYLLGNGYWNCPLCEKKCYFCALEVDRKLLEIIKKAPKDCSNVELNANGEVVKYIDDIGNQCEGSEDVSIIDL